jgi:protein-tyrosine phosphatase
MNSVTPRKLWLWLIGAVTLAIAFLVYGFLFLNFFRRLRFWWRDLAYHAPLDISEITNELFVASWPANHHVAELKALNIRLIVCMFWEPQARALTKPPFENLQLHAIDLFLFPIPLKKLVRGVEAALSKIEQGERVMVYCKQGVHRSVALACCILIAQGYTASEAMSLVKQRRPIADPYAPHIRRRIEAFEKYWRQAQTRG